MNPKSMDNIEKQDGPDTGKRKSRRTLLLICAVLAAFLCITALVINLSVSRQPLYHYRNFTWSPDSVCLAFIRTPLGTGHAASRSGPQLQEICLVYPGAPESRKIAAFRCTIDSLRILGWSRQGTVIYLIDEEEGVTELMGLRSQDGKITKFRLEMAHMSRIFYDRGIFAVLLRDPSTGKKMIGYFDEKDFGYHEIMPLEEKEREELDLLAMKASPSGDRIALGIYYEPGKEDEGHTCLCVYDIARRKAIKCDADSNGKSSDFEWSPADPVIAARVVEKTEWSSPSYTILFCDALDPESVQKLSTVEMKKSFELFWSSQNKLFIIMDDALFLMPVRLDKPVAKVLFSWNSLGFKPAEFAISPDGRKIAFHMLDDRTSFDDCFIINVDGTGRQKLIEPEGRRILERTKAYRFLDAIRRVIADFSRLLRGRR
jgi:hypothetical protein